MAKSWPDPQLGKVGVRKCHAVLHTKIIEHGVTDQRTGHRERKRGGGREGGSLKRLGHNRGGGGWG